MTFGADTIRTPPLTPLASPTTTATAATIPTTAAPPPTTANSRDPEPSAGDKDKSPKQRAQRRETFIVRTSETYETPPVMNNKPMFALKRRRDEDYYDLVQNKRANTSGYSMFKVSLEQTPAHSSEIAQALAPPPAAANVSVPDASVQSKVRCGVCATSREALLMLGRLEDPVQQQALQARLAQRYGGLALRALSRTPEEETGEGEAPLQAGAEDLAASGLSRWECARTCARGRRRRERMMLTIDTYLASWSLRATYISSFYTLTYHLGCILLRST